MKNRLALTLLIFIIGLDSSIAATTSVNKQRPTEGHLNITNFGNSTKDTSKWSMATNAAAAYPKGQTFTTSSTDSILKSITLHTITQVAPQKTYSLRIGKINTVDKTFTEVHREEATQTVSWNANEYMTWTLEEPVLLEPDTMYGFDLGIVDSSVGWQAGIAYLSNADDSSYSSGYAYTSGRTGHGLGDATIAPIRRDRLFHIELAHPLEPSPLPNSLLSAGGQVTLQWSLSAAKNSAPENFDVWVDVWFAENPSFTEQNKIVDRAKNLSQAIVNAPTAATFYWKVVIYSDVNSEQPQIEGVFSFNINDTDGDGIPDDIELLYSGSPVALLPNGDLDGDGLTNLNEFLRQTNLQQADTDKDGLLDGEEVSGFGTRPPTDPNSTDSDSDGLSDYIESNAGYYTSKDDTGTNPVAADTDKDGIKDGEEVSLSLDPHNGDSDQDGANDWYELFAAFTDPNSSISKPNVPYPLPKKGALVNNNLPVKVYILSGQSNMVGFGRIDGQGAGTLETLVTQEHKFPNLYDNETQAWHKHDNVMYSGVIAAKGKARLRPGFGAKQSSFGPELGFGRIMGYYHQEPVIIIKCSIGNRSLAWDYLPPGSERFSTVEADQTWRQAGYGDSPKRWLDAISPRHVRWYAGKQFDDCFLDENDRSYTADLMGFKPVRNVVDILDNFSQEYPNYASRGFEIAGYVWWQGHKDQNDLDASRYEFNLVNFINAVRGYYQQRYPAQTQKDAPFVLATVAFNGGWDNKRAAFNTIVNSQLAVSGERQNYPEFQGNVKTVEVRDYWRDQAQSPSRQGFHYNHNAETYMLVGDALGRSMIDLKNGKLE